MAIPKFSEDMNIISRIGDKPGEDSGLTTEQFKAKFDEGNKKIQDYLNDTLVPAIENTAPGLYSVTMHLTVCNLRYYQWSNNMQTVSVQKVIDDSSRQAVIAVAAPASLDSYQDFGIRMISQGAGTITFQCEDVPSTNISVNVLVLTKGG
jgi:hypothetical protein